MGGFLPSAERRSGAVLGLYAILSLFLLLAGERIPTAALRGAGAFVFAPFDRVVLSVDRMAAAWRENQELHQRIAELRLENERLQIAGRELSCAAQSLPPRAASHCSRSRSRRSGEVPPTAATVSAGAPASTRAIQAHGRRPASASARPTRT
jgi:hypothetical protein